MSTKNIKRSKELLEKLKEGINQVKSGREFKRILATMAKFHSYSWRNNLLIWLQCPAATRVAGYRTWQKMGRSVRKGEKAVWIFAPLLIKRKEENEEDEEQVVTMFRPVPVFDYSQTEGEPLPTMTGKYIPNTHEELLSKLKKLCGKMKIEIVFEELSGIEGVSKIGKIIIDSKKNPTEQAVILLHELAHEIIHDSSEKRCKLNTEQKEMEAEATAYILGQHIGLPETNSADYLSLYHKSYDLQESLAVIHGASQKIIGALMPGKEENGET